jgi:hypothetical protein
MGTRVLSLVTKRPELEVDHSPPSIAEMENEWNYTSIRTMYTCGPQVIFMFLGANAKLRRANISFVMSVCLSVRPSARMEQLGSKRSDFHENLYLGVFRKCILLKSAKNNG